MNFIYERITYIFDPLHHLWEHEKMHRKISVLLVLFFLGSLVGIELKRQGMLPHSLAQFIPGNHFYAVQAAFTVVLILEVISLIFTLPCSFSRSVGKQFEILSLILMRNAFKALSQFPEPITFAGNEEAILHILSDGFGALVIFALLGYYYKIQAFASEETMRPTDLYSFVAAKKGIALILLAVFAFMGIEGAVVISAKARRAADVGRSEVELPIAYDGRPIETTFDPRYLMDALKTLDPTTTVSAELIDNRNAAVFRTEDHYSYVVMPLTRPENRT